MDFTNYPNIALIDAKLGGAKQSFANKKAYAKAEEAWMRLGQNGIAQINYEAPQAVQVLSAFVMPSAVVCMEMRVLNVIPVSDIIWVYGDVVKSSVNFIPTDKTHSLRLVTRTGEVHTLGSKITLALSKKDITGDAINQIAPVLSQKRPGIFFGYSDELANAVKQNFQSVVNAVDERCYNALQNNNTYGNIAN